MSPALVLDVLMVLALPLLAWRALSAPDLFQGCVAFITYGLLLALCWGRLGAPDVALAEAGIGAGFTGALLLKTLARLGPREQRRGSVGGWGPALLALGLGGALLWALLGLPEPDAQLPRQVHARLPESGVSNPVTAVLLNFRGYDTLLEVGVLLLAVMAAGALPPTGQGAPADSRVEVGPLLPATVGLLAPVAILVAVYLLWVGGHAPGGAFQAAALLAAVGVLLEVSGRWGAWQEGRLLRVGWVLGFATFLAVAVGTALAEGELLEFPPGAGYPLILLIEAAAMVSIALIFTGLFRGHGPLPPPAGGGGP